MVGKIDKKWWGVAGVIALLIFTVVVNYTQPVSKVLSSTGAESHTPGTGTTVVAAKVCGYTETTFAHLSDGTDGAKYTLGDVEVDLTWQQNPIEGNPIAIERLEGRTYKNWAETIDPAFISCIAAKASQFQDKTKPVAP